MLTMLLVLMGALQDEPAPCSQIDANTFVCPASGESLAEVDTDTTATILVPNESGLTYEIDGWSCSGAFCTQGFDLVADEEVEVLVCWCVSSGSGCSSFYCTGRTHGGRIKVKPKNKP